MSLAPPRRGLKIGLLWHSTRSGNLGVGALTVSNMAIAREVALSCDVEPHFTVLGFRDAGTGPAIDFGAEVAQHDIDFRWLLSPGGFRRTVRDFDCVLDIGLGDSFAEIYGPKRFAFLWITKMLAVSQRVPLLLSPQTIGPFSRRPYRALAAMAMRRARAVVARDDRSLSVARELAPDANLILSADVAFELPYVDQSGMRGAQGLLRVGINASGLLFHEAESGRNRFGLSYDYADFTRALIAQLQARGDCEVHLVPHVIDRTNAVDDDSRLADRLAEEFSGVIRTPDFTSPSEAKSYISGLDFLVAARMHACIAAFSSGTNVLPVCYSRKFLGLFEMLGYDRLLPVTGIDLTGALAAVANAIGERDALSVRQDAAMGRVAGALSAYRTELARLFVALRDGKRA